MDIRFHSAEKSGIRLDGVVIATFDDAGGSTGGRFANASFANLPFDWLEDSSALADHTGKRNEITVFPDRFPRRFPV
jgi:hypothetical protein